MSKSKIPMKNYASPQSEKYLGIQAFHISELPAILKKGRTSIYGEINSGRLKSLKCGRNRLVTLPDIAEWQANLRVTSTKTIEVA